MLASLEGSAHRDPVAWPLGRFAFTVFDDPDGQSLETSRLVYGLLSDMGFQTTIAVWPLGPRRLANSGGETCANPAYLDHLRTLQDKGFEIAWHLATPHTSSREETMEGLDKFRQLFGHDPDSMANHYNGEALYWGPARLGGLSRSVYSLMTGYSSANRYFGHVAGHPYFWGDLCRERIRYCRNFVFSNINTLTSCPWMPYEDPARPWVNRWFAASEGADGTAFRRLLSEANQDQLEEEGGASIVYTHFGHGFVENGKLNSTFVRLMERLRLKSGWFVPVNKLLDYLSEKKCVCILDTHQRRSLERRWLIQKLLRGTS